MSSFTRPVELRVVDSYLWELINPFVYYIDEPDGESIEIPAGFITDLASTPRILWVSFPPFGRHTKAAILHDYLYATGLVDRKTADDIFLTAMKVLGVKRWRRTLMYYAVRVFGKKAYKG